MDLVTLYIVDENLLTRITQKKNFENEQKYKIIGDFACVKSCLEKMKSKQADIILIDIDLPYIDGIDAIKMIKKLYPKTKVIVLTSCIEKEKVLSSLANGASGYVLKNNENSNLINSIEKVLKGEFWLDSKIANLAFCALQKTNKNYKSFDYDNEFVENLTSREMEVLKLMIDGKTNSQIAREIIVSTNTAKAHVGNILTKLSVKDRVQAVVKAVRANIF